MLYTDRSYLWPGVPLALASAVLFGVSTPLSKLLLGEVAPQLLAGLLYLGAGAGLVCGARNYRPACNGGAAVSIRYAVARRHYLVWRRARAIVGSCWAWLELMRLRRRSC